MTNYRKRAKHARTKPLNRGTLLTATRKSVQSRSNINCFTINGREAQTTQL